MSEVITEPVLKQPWVSPGSFAPANNNLEWTHFEKVAFRIAFIYFALYSIPLDEGFYRYIYNLELKHLNYRHLTEIVAFYNPQFINHFSEGGFFGLESYVNLPFVLLLAVAGAAVWGYFDKASTNYRNLYYWIRVLARYRVAYAAIAWGYKKIFIMQMPYPNEGILNTEMIDFFAKRLYWEQLGIVPAYEFFLGFAEFIGGFLLLFRRTTGIGAAIALVVFGNIAISNHAYDIGEHVPSACMAILSLFILWKDLPAIWNLLVKHVDSQVTHFYPVLNKWPNLLRLSIKFAGNLVFVILFFILEVYAYTHNDFYKIPNTPGLPGARGNYHVTTFKLNGKLIPYSPTDSIRWHDATFEEFSSLSFKVANRPQDIEMFAAGSYPRRGEVYTNKWTFDWRGDVRRFPEKKEKRDPSKRDINISWELSGVAGRQWYYYKADTVNQVLHLQNKNRVNRHLKQTLHYERIGGSRIILRGRNEFNDSVYVVLDRVNRKYPLEQSLNRKWL